MAGSKECMGVSLWLELNDKLFTNVSQAFKHPWELLPNVFVDILMCGSIDTSCEVPCSNGWQTQQVSLESCDYIHLLM